MIIQIRGTSGSGKTYVMRQVMERLSSRWDETRILGRSQPLYYHHNNIVVLGHYNTACGGCDTIGSARKVYELIQELLAKPCWLCGKKFHHILCEGLLLSEDVKWSSQLKELRVVYLSTSLERCLNQIRERRKAAGNLKPLNEGNTTRRIGVIQKSRVKLEALGIRCVGASSFQAPRLILKWLGENDGRL